MLVEKTAFEICETFYMKFSIHLVKYDLSIPTTIYFVIRTVHLCAFMGVCPSFSCARVFQSILRQCTFISFSSSPTSNPDFSHTLGYFNPFPLSCLDQGIRDSHEASWRSNGTAPFEENKSRSYSLKSLIRVHFIQLQRPYSRPV